MTADIRQTSPLDPTKIFHHVIIPPPAPGRGLFRRKGEMLYHDFWPKSNKGAKTISPKYRNETKGHLQPAQFCARWQCRYSPHIKGPDFGNLNVAPQKPLNTGKPRIPHAPAASITFTFATVSCDIQGQSPQEIRVLLQGLTGQHI